MAGHDLVGDTNVLLRHLVDELFPEDDVQCNFSLIHLPYDGVGLLPTGVVYLQVMGTDEADGVYASQIIFPSSVDRDNLRAIVQSLANGMEERLKQIRASVAAGHKQEAAAMVLPPERVGG